MFDHIRRWEQSGLSQRDYCQKARIKRSVFYYWLKIDKGRLDDQPLPSAFLPVVIEDAKPDAAKERILVTAPNGLVVSFPNHASSIPLIRQLMTG